VHHSEKGFEINGEYISASEASSLIKMLYNDAKQVAGVFHGMNRSRKFRKNWPNEYLFAESEWKTFVTATRQMYVDRLKDPKTLPSDAQRMFRALYLERLASVDQEQDTRLQLSPNTQQFEGDKYENKNIVEKFGEQSNSFAELALGTTALADGVVKH
jgi:hypothetical protein